MKISISYKKLFQILSGWRTILTKDFGPLFSDPLRIQKRKIQRTEMDSDTAKNTNIKRVKFSKQSDIQYDD